MNYTSRPILMRFAGAMCALLLITAALFASGLVTAEHAIAAVLGGGGLAAFGLTALQSDDYIKYLIAIGFLDAGGGIKKLIKAKTADYTIVTITDPSGTIFTNRGAAGAVNFTLPAAAQGLAGTFYYFLGAANQNIVVLTPVADTLTVVNDAAADSLAMSTASQKLGSCIMAVCDGTAWFAFGIAIGAGGDTGTSTYTIAT